MTGAPRRPRRSGRTVALLTAAFFAAAHGAGGAARPGPFVTADTENTGWIDLYVFDQPGSRVRYLERIGGRTVSLGTGAIAMDAPATRLRRAARWRCDRRVRRFAARVRRADGSVHSAAYTVRTPSCADRVSIAAPARVEPGAPARVTLRDGWGLGDLTVRLCARPPGGGGSCRRVAFGGASSVSRTVRPLRDGRWTLEARFAGVRVRRALASGGPAPGASRVLPTVLVTGDSTVEGIDSRLADRLARTAHVRRAWKGGSSVSSDEWHWVARAASQARRFAPRITVISMGANEGWPLSEADGTRVDCCGDRWAALYAQRIRPIMRSFEQGGAGRVLWLLLPTPRQKPRQVISSVVNGVVSEVAATEPAVTLVHLERVISPGGRFHRTLPYRGRTRVVRQPDGIHLTDAGAAIATDLIVRTLGRYPGWDG